MLTVENLKSTKLTLNKYTLVVELLSASFGNRDYRIVLNVL